MRPIDADALLSDRMKTKFYHLPNGDVAIPLIDVEHAPTIGGWISVKDRLPNEKRVYLVYAPDYKPGSSRGQPNHNGIMFSYWNGTAWSIEILRGYRYRRSIVRYWMPLPTIPEANYNDD